MARMNDLPLELPSKYYPAIGETLYRWALLEFQMQAIIWRAMGLDNRQGRTLTVGMKAPVLIGILRTLTLKWAVNKTEIRSIKALATDAQDLADDRNILAHGVWMYPQGGDPSDVFLHYMKKSHYRILPHAEKKSPRNIKSTATKIRKLNERAERLLARIVVRQKASL